MWPNTTTSGRVARDAGLDRIGERLRIHNVLQEKPAAGEFDHFSQPVMETRIIRIAGNRRHRRDLFQRQDDGRQADVAAVEDMVHAGEKLREAGIEVVMGVGDDADSHGAWCVVRDSVRQPCRR